MLLPKQHGIIPPAAKVAQALLSAGLIVHTARRLSWRRLAQSARSSLPAVLVFVLAFFPRAMGLVGPTSIWQSRYPAFMAAISSRDWGATLLALHPGVTTMWLAALGRWASMI
jgi:hypothetical protein